MVLIHSILSYTLFCVVLSGYYSSRVSERVSKGVSKGVSERTSEGSFEGVFGKVSESSHYLHHMLQGLALSLMLRGFIIHRIGKPLGHGDRALHIALVVQEQPLQGGSTGTP